MGCGASAPVASVGRPVYFSGQRYDEKRPQVGRNTVNVRRIQPSSRPWARRGGTRSPTEPASSPCLRTRATSKCRCPRSPSQSQSPWRKRRLCSHSCQRETTRWSLCRILVLNSIALLTWHGSRDSSFCLT